MMIDLLIVPIGVSRILSLSMIIDSLYKLRNVLCQDQIVELCFVSTFQNSQLLINACFDNMAMKEYEVYAQYNHPFYAWYKATTRLFNAYQGGSFNRYSCGSNSFIQMFDGKKSNYDTSAKLHQVVVILYEWIDYINLHHGKILAEEIPYFDVLTKMKLVLGKVKKAVGSSIKFSM